MEDFDMLAVLKLLMAGGNLDEVLAERTMTAILDGTAQPEQIGVLLAALHFRNVGAKELSGFAKALLATAPSHSYENPRDILDVCGTGGDGIGTFNVSTAVAFVVAGAGQKVAKHGNRAVSSRCGSFDVLEALGIGFATTPQEAEASLRKQGLSFLFAPAFYPVLKKLATLRRNIGVRTVFNALGPLLNPVRVGRQLMGVYAESLLVPVAEALRQLGTQEAMIVRGEDGTDELSLETGTRVAHLKNGRIETFTLQPSDFGLQRQPLSAIAGGDPQENARLLLSVLKGDQSPYRDVTLLNATAALVVGGKARDFHQGMSLASQAIDSGKALALLQGMRAKPHQEELA